MSFVNKKTTFCLITILVVVASFFILSKVNAQSEGLSDQQILLIKANCSSTKATLNQLHSSDALLRVNVGQSYESMSTKLMERFNVRSANSGYNSQLLIDSEASYSKLLDNFRLSYINYEKQLTLAMNVDCINNPAGFYDAISLARAKRNRIKEDVVKLNQALDSYKYALDKFGDDNNSKLAGIK